MKKLLFFICTILFTIVINAQNNFVLLDVSENSEIIKDVSVILDSTNKVTPPRKSNNRN